MPKHSRWCVIPPRTSRRYSACDHTSPKPVLALGVGAALAALAAIIGALGPGLARFPIDSLRVVVGTLGLIALAMGR